MVLYIYSPELSTDLALGIIEVASSIWAVLSRQRRLQLIGTDPPDLDGRSQGTSSAKVRGLLKSQETRLPELRKWTRSEGVADCDCRKKYNWFKLDLPG